MMTPKEIAQQIVDDLFVTGGGEHVTRLVLTDDSKPHPYNNRSGWGKEPARDRIEGILVRCLKAFPWVSVNERMPVEHARVQFYGTGVGICEGSYGDNGFGGRRWTDFDADERYPEEYVTHWREIDNTPPEVSP